MAQQQACPQCGANNAIPPSGLSIRCEFCGCERPVPDAAQRRLAAVAEKRAQKQAERAARKQAKEERRSQRKKRSKQRRAVVRWLRGTFYTLLPFIIIGAITYAIGLWEPFVGDAGHGRIAQLTEELHSYGYRQLGDRREERSFATKIIYVEVEAGRCYAVAIASGQRVERAELRVPSARKPAVVHTTNLYHDILYHCADQRAALEAKITLASFGRFSWMQFAREDEGGDHVLYPDGCRLRSKPSRRARKIGRAQPAVPYPVLEEKRKWRRIRLRDGKEGWANCSVR